MGRQTRNLTRREPAAEAEERGFRLLDAHRRADSSWVGELSSSALATAMSALALRLLGHPAESGPVAGGLAWLAATRNPDGGWGDAPGEPSNMNATSIAAAALARCAPRRYREEVAGGRRWVEEHGGFAALNDPRTTTLSGPGRTLWALAGLVPPERVRKLPTEMILLPRRIRRTVSTTFPAFLSLSLLHERFRPSPRWRRPLRRRAEREALAWLRRAQGPNGSYEESAFLTSLIAAALTAAGAEGGDIVRRALPFVLRSRRPDGSWPIDRDLENFDTTQAILAHHEAGRPLREAGRVRKWLLDKQFRRPFFPTSSPPGGWAWAYPAGWPDTDDTACALRSLRLLGVPAGHPSIRLGLRWLYRMQNRDGSWPTFVRGSRMPFDHGCPYITSQVLSALALMGPEARRGAPLRRALAYLRRAQRPDGSLGSLWFRPHTRGTAAAVEAFSDLGLSGDPLVGRAARWLAEHQNPDGGWGDGHGAPSTAEETAWASAALLRLGGGEAARKGVRWLVERQDPGGGWKPAVIGLYYASLSYSDTFYALSYPLVALARHRRLSR